jgi:UV DNA damage endonuclease
VYGSKPRALARFAAAFDRLSPSLRARLTLENDDRPNSYSVADLLPLHAACGIPLTFDLHHHAFCPGGQSREEALGAALATWPRGVRPVVHWSEPPECPDRARAHPHAHSAFVYGPISAHGREGEVDVMIESKAKEVALLLYRDEIAPRRRAADAAAAAALPPLQQQFAAQ